MLSFSTMNRIAAMRVGVGNLNRSSSQIKASSVPVKALSAPAQETRPLEYALFDGLAGPVSTPTFSGGFQLLENGFLAENGPVARVTSASIEIAAAAYRPMFFNLCATGRAMPRVRLLFSYPNDQTEVCTLHGVRVGEMEQAGMADSYPQKIWMLLNFGSMTHKLQPNWAPL